MSCKEHMECLGVPIDYRLRRIIRQARPIEPSGPVSKHAEHLRDFETSLANEGKCLPTEDLDFGCYIARPETKGGVLVLLERPHSSQDNTNGPEAGIRNCRTLDAVSKLITTVNHDQISFDDVSVFDSIPLLDEKTTHVGMISRAHDVFANMFREKEPDVVICCFRDKTCSINPLVKLISSVGVGRSFEDTKQNPRSIEPGLSLTRVNAFHPSYAINYRPGYSSFKRLLILEFTKAFACYRGSWTEEPWMKSLRDECRRMVKEVENDCPKARWKSLLASLEMRIDRCFNNSSRGAGGSETYIPDRLIEFKGITWICCDIALFLEETSLEVLQYLGVVDRRGLLGFLMRWCSQTWPSVRLEKNPNDCRGYYEPSQLEILKCSQKDLFVKKFEQRFQKFLRDFNLSYVHHVSLDEHSYTCKILRLARTFQRFAIDFENLLEDLQGNLLEKSSVPKQTEIIKALESLKLN